MYNKSFLILNAQFDYSVSIYIGKIDHYWAIRNSIVEAIIYKVKI